jgi:hypothetical protein
MENFKVVCLQRVSDFKPPPADDVEKTIAHGIAQGWQFVQIATGAAANEGHMCTWAYIVFKR